MRKAGRGNFGRSIGRAATALTTATGLVVLALAAPAGGALSASVGPASAHRSVPHLFGGYQGYWLFGADGRVYPYGPGVPPFEGDLGGKTLNAPIVGGAAYGDIGYYEVASDGGVFNFGEAPFDGSAGSIHLNKPIVGMATSPFGNGYWLVASDGGIFTYGGVGFYGSVPGALKPGQILNKPIVGIDPTPDGRGYWMVASDGGIFSFGDASFYGSTGGIVLNQPIVGMAESFAGSGNGYYLVASDGGIFAFGPDAPFLGSAGGLHLNRPVVGMADNPDGNGYWLVASDGGIFTYGAAQFEGSAASGPIGAPIVGMAAPFPLPPFVSGMADTPDGHGYALVDIYGDVGNSGDAGFHGDLGSQDLSDPVNGIAMTADGGGYWLVGGGGELSPFGDAQNFGTHLTSGVDDPVRGMVATNSSQGYWEFTAAGEVFHFGDAPNYGDTTSNGAGPFPGVDVVAMAADRSDTGYVLLNHDGGLYTLGDVVFHGSAVFDNLGGEAAGIAFTGDGNGYWILGVNGAVYPFGDATTLPGPAPNPEVLYQGIVPTPDHGGYWLFDYLGDVYAYGDAVLFPFSG
ncbi:MAG TPA: hypothetical protein VG244_12295 [Acidimicrobiales bacterium]|nr:hypothetical protein [Acidimicrobiales bacterium]